MKATDNKKSKITKKVAILLAAAGVVVLLGGTSAYAAHSDALPGSTLFPFKQLWEQGQLLTSFSPADKAQTNINIAKDRLNSLQTTAPSQATPGLQNAQNHLNAALDNSNGIKDQNERKSVKQKISDTEDEIENEVEQESKTSTDANDKQDLQKTSDDAKQVQAQAQKDD